ncbi:MAG: universal stress protein [Vicinamibacterales bacterium]
MITITHILCPVDFSECSRRALEQASTLARWYDARVTVLHVYPPPPITAAATFEVGGPGTPVPVADVDLAALETEVRAFMGEAFEGLAVDVRLRTAPSAHREILEVVSALDIDLLVMGSHGRTGFERLFLGSVAEKVLRSATCPVMIVPAHGEGHPARALTTSGHVLCPVDFSEGSLAALEYALSLAEEGDATLTLLHVIPIPPELAAHFPRAADVDRVRAEAEADALRQLRALVPETARQYCTVESRAVIGSPAHEIEREAAGRPADLIVMGVQGRGTLDRLVFGSTAERVVRGARCPVLVLRAR